jgi:hypothetical protein
LSAREPEKLAANLAPFSIERVSSRRSRRDTLVQAMYSQGVAQFDDLFAEDHSPPLEDVALVRAFLPGVSSILDIGAGTGRLAFARLAAEFACRS